MSIEKSTSSNKILKRKINSNIANSSSNNSTIVHHMEKRHHQISIHEYRNEIHNHLVELELQLEDKPIFKPNLLLKIKNLRSNILNSLFDVNLKMGWSFSTFSLSVNLFDIYTNKVKILESNYRLVAFCCLWIASKYNENKPKGKLINALIKRAGYNLNKKSEFLKIEFDILNILNWDLSLPTIESFLDLFLNTSEPNNIERRLGSMFLCELSHFNLEIFENYSPSSIAASSIMITNIAMLNLRHKHIREHRFDELDSLMLKSVINIAPSIKFKYIDSDINYFKNNNMVIYNLIHLATNFVKQLEHEKQQLNHYNSIQFQNNNYQSILDSNIITNLPISPMSSPITNPYSFISTPSTQLSSSIRSTVNADDQQSSGRHSRSQSLSALRSVIPTPGTTPTINFSSRLNNSNNSVSNSNSQQSFATPQIFTPVQFVHQPPLLYPQPYRYDPQQQQKEINSSHTNSYRQLPVLTRSKTKSLFQSNDHNTIFSAEQFDHNNDYKKRKLQ